MTKNTIVKNSKIESRGVFAARDFKKGEIVLKWKSNKILTQEEVNKLSDKEKRYVSSRGDNKYLLEKPPERYVNHSCNPNTNVINDCDVAIRDIEKGEEITADYIKEKVPLSFKCNCGSKNCKGQIKTNYKKR